MIDYNKAMANDFSDMTNTEVKAYKAMYDGGYHPGEVIDFENAVCLCNDALIEQSVADKNNNQLSDELLLRIDDAIDDWCTPAIELGVAAHKNKPIPKRYANNPIYVEYYNGIKSGKKAQEMRLITLPKVIRQYLEKNKC